MSDLTTEILIDIRNELRANREELGEHIRGTNTRLDRVVHEQVRHATAIVALENRLGSALEGVNARLDGVNARLEGMNTRLDNVLVGSIGQTVRAHESRIQRLEEQSGLGPFEK